MSDTEGKQKEPGIFSGPEYIMPKIIVAGLIIWIIIEVSVNGWS